MERIRDLRRFVETHLSVVVGGETAGARDVVGVDVGVDHIAEAEAALREKYLSYSSIAIDGSMVAAS